MNIGIVGAGFTGLSAAYALQKAGHTVTLLEKESVPGGLAIGFKKDNWEWPLEKHYHHIFTSDTAIRELAREVSVPFRFTRPNTSSLIDGDIIQLDSPLKLLTFPKLTPLERVQMGAVLGYLRYIADWHILESVTAHEWLTRMMGKNSYSMLWEPLLQAKFGGYYKTISLAWFWARIKARSTQLGYPDGGFQTLADTLAHIIQKKKGGIYYESAVKHIASEKNEVSLTVTKDQKDTVYAFDRVLVTVPHLLFNAMAPGLPSDYKTKLRDASGIGAVNMVLELREPLLPDQVYWLNICEKKYPFLAVVEHTHFIDKTHYGNNHIVYVGNYLPHGHKYFAMNEDELLKEYDQKLAELKGDYKKTIVSISVFKAPFAQPIMTKQFSKKILPHATPLHGVYLANMQQVYPWDRGTNFAVEMGAAASTEMVK